MTDPHIAELERRIDEGQTLDALRRTGAIDLGVGIQARIPVDPAVTHGGYAKHPHASMSLPTDMREGTIVNREGFAVREHKDGTYSTLDGRPIIATKRDRDMHLKRAGYVEWDGAPDS